MIAAVGRGERPKRPSESKLADEIWVMMQECWDPLPERRPKPRAILRTVQDLRSRVAATEPSMNSSFQEEGQVRDLQAWVHGLIIPWICAYGLPTG